VLLVRLGAVRTGVLGTRVGVVSGGRFIAYPTGGMLTVTGVVSKGGES
jgi:hypothetical protein